MKRRTLKVLTAALGLATTAWQPAAAQSSPLVPGRIFLSAGTGYGGAALSCASCSSSRESSFAFTGRAGAALRQNLELALEVTAWSKDFGNSTSNSTARTVFADAVAQWYPLQSSGFFVKGGGGLAFIREDIASTGIPRTRIEANTSDLVAGLGWDVPVARRIALTPYADLHHAPRTSAKVNGTTSTQQLGANLLHIGVAATWR